ncbi:uncharacterized protein BDW43DRAFT_120208 [Aspergillus alliaceus]|uniref:uncharacterized protein n=1 Tax=Petromyces alliaceus TaxID=209559 RepID=UPI0012A6A787|nr:uncharacterized protein BDW43DRAFT_120208 [Aspergillus alliaceus]KAB8238608.1 hypothetical protein BDW43DRAFT_120208 [Aspergillus alliaceus]
MIMNNGVGVLFSAYFLANSFASPWFCWPEYPAFASLGKAWNLALLAIMRENSIIRKNNFEKKLDVKYRRSF